MVSGDGTGIVSQAGGLLLTRAVEVVGLGRGLEVALERWRPARAVHSPGKIVTDLAVALALGGDCLADVATLRSQPELFGPVASDPVVSRLVARLAGDAPRALKAIRAARAAARARAWELAGDAAPGAGGGLVTVDIDATIVTACSEKEQAAPTWKKTYGHHPLTVFADHGPAGTGEALAVLLRPGNAGSNTAADHIEATRLSLAQLPRHLLAAQRAVALGAAYHGGAGPVGFAWVRDRAGGPVQVLAAGRGLAVAADGRGVVLKVPAGGRGAAIGAGGLARALGMLPCWVRIAGVADSLLAAESSRSGPGRMVRPSLEDGLLAAWTEPFAWLVLAEPANRAELQELAFAVYAAQGRRSGSTTRRRSWRCGGCRTGIRSCGRRHRRACGGCMCWPTPGINPLEPADPGPGPVHRDPGARGGGGLR
jgi:hypothetical protein